MRGGDEPLAVGVLMPLPWCPRTPGGNLLTGFFEQVEGEREKGRKWCLVGKSLGGTGGMSALCGVECKAEILPYPKDWGWW